MAKTLQLSDVLARLDYRPSGRGYRARCPAHGGDNPTSLGILAGEDGKVLFCCYAHGCTQEDILRALGLWDEQRTPATDRQTGYTKPPKPHKLTDDEKIIISCAGREAMGLLCGPLPEQPTDPELIPPYGAFLEDLWEVYTNTGSHEEVQAAYIAMRPALAEAMPKFMRALDRRLKDKLGQVLPSLAAEPKAQAIIRGADEITEKPIEWLWYPYIPRYMLVILDGDPGIGKSLTLLQVATNLSRGWHFPDQFGKPTLAPDVDGPQTTLFLSAEDSLEYIMVPRLKRAGADLSRIKFLTGWHDAKGEEQSFTFDHLPLLTEQLDAYKPALVILDPLVAYMGDRDIYRSTDTRPLMAKLRAVAERYACTIIGVRHPAKLDQGGPLMYRGQGNADIIGAARSGLWVQKHPTHPETHSLMLHSKTNIATFGRTVIFSRERGEFQWACVSRLTEAMLTGKGPDPHAFLEAFFWLEETMKPGHPYESAQLEKDAEARQISHKVLSRAKKALGITAKQLGTRWYCTLPPLPTHTHNNTGNTGVTGSTGYTGYTGYSEPKSMSYESDAAEYPVHPVDPVTPEYPVSPVVIRAREDMSLSDEPPERCPNCGYVYAERQRVCFGCGRPRIKEVS